MSILVENYHKHYGTTAAVAGISFTVSAGEILGLVGQNGAGKTTTLRALAGGRRDGAKKHRCEGARRLLQKIVSILVG